MAIIFIGSAIISVGYDNILLTKVLAESWELDNKIGQGKKNMNIETIQRVVNKTTVYPDYQNQAHLNLTLYVPMILMYKILFFNIYLTRNSRAISAG